MMIRAKNVELELTGDEVYLLACHIKNNLMQTIKDHWNNLQRDEDGESLFFERNEKDLRMMREMYEVSGYSHCFEGAVDDYKRLFEKRRAERATPQEQNSAL